MNVCGDVRRCMASFPIWEERTSLIWSLPGEKFSKARIYYEIRVDWTVREGFRLPLYFEMAQGTHQ